MSDLSEWLKGELSQCERAKAVGLSRNITPEDAAAGFSKAAEQIEDLERMLRSHERPSGPPRPSRPPGHTPVA